MKKLLIAMTLSVSLLVAGCTVVPISEVQHTSNSNAAAAVGYQGDASFDPEAYAEENWEQIVQNAAEAARPMEEVLPAYQADAKAAGAEYGVRVLDDDTSPWNYIVKDTVKVLNVDRDSKKGRMEVDMAPYDGQADYVVQVGPIYSGAALRDSSTFIKFGDFKNQITYGELAKALNKQAGTAVVEPAKVDDMVGKEISIVGVFPDGDEVLVMPVAISAEG